MTSAQNAIIPSIQPSAPAAEGADSASPDLSAIAALIPRKDAADPLPADATGPAHAAPAAVVDDAQTAPAPPRFRWLRRPRLPRLPMWLVPVAMFLTLAALTVALYHAELTLEINQLEQDVFTHRGSQWVLWGGLVGSLLVSGLAYLALMHRQRDHEQTRRNLQALESLHAISSTLIGRIDAGGNSALVELCESARRLLNMDRAGIQLLDAEHDRLELLAYAGDMPVNPEKYYDLKDLPNVRWCLETGQVLFAEDVRRLDRPQNTELLEKFRVRSMALIPLLVQGEQIGLLTASSAEPHAFADVDRRLAALFGSQAAVILANTRLYEAQQSAVQKYKALLDQRELLFSTNASIYQTDNLEDSLRRIAELAPIALTADACIVALSAKPPDNVRVAAVTPGAHSRHMHVGKQFFCPAAERAFQRGAICVFANAATDADVALLREAFPDMGSIAVVPLTGRDGTRIGVLALLRRQSGVFSSEQLKMGRIFSTRAAAAIENARLYQETRRALEDQKKLLAQRDTLWAVNAAVYRAGTLEESLNRIARLAPPALGVDLCAVDLAAERDGEIYLAAITDDLGRELIGQPFEARGLNAGRALETREALVVEDARKDPGIPPQFLQRFRIGSLAYFPLLRSDGEALGLLVLVRHKPGPFDKAQLELARVFSTRAASAIENAQLLEQTRRDAATKAMLLRELNHRVKNNLAGIVALLSMGQPEMPPAAQRWLDRVTDRVRVMAGAHELFVGDAEAVPLAHLVQRMMSSLAVARAPGVDMRIELSPSTRGVELRTEHAISLAMVLHELCFNAIVHGLGAGGGSVTLRTRHAAPGRLAVDVIDTGRWREPEEHVPDGHDGNGNGADRGRTGIGLELVRGLVSRELLGQFSLDRSAAGGTVATVEFPLHATQQPAGQGHSGHAGQGALAVQGVPRDREPTLS